MLPGLTRTAAHPASIAANTYLGWKWMSAITGIWDFLAITGRASASSWLGTATRTMSQPVAVSSAICCSVALTSAVTVVVMDCTEIGCSLPTPTLPTCNCRVGRRGASTWAGAVGIPTVTDISNRAPTVWLWSEADRVDDVGGHREQHDPPADQHDNVGQRQQVEHADEEVHRGQHEQEQLPQPAVDGVPADDGRAHHADRPLRVVLAGDRAEQRGDLLREALEALPGGHEHVAGEVDRGRYRAERAVLQVGAE